MKIVNVIKESFLEYKDFISLVLFCFGCNMKCSYCYNYNYVTNTDNVIIVPIEKIIKDNITPITDSVIFLGGEPTIYGDKLLETARYSKEKHNLSVKIFSNGSNPPLLIDGAKQGLFDSVSVDFKCYTKNDDITYNGNWNDYISGINLIFDAFEKYNMIDKLEIRTTVIPSIEKDVPKIKEICASRGVKFIYQDDVKKSYEEINAISGGLCD
jgi:pyruvate formate lyase activating enzyme